MVIQKKMLNSYAVVKRSGIHNRGFFAKKDIFKGTRIIEYVGEKVTKAESRRREAIHFQKNKANSKHGAVYMFELNKRYEIDGCVPYNTARVINHSCNPNCKAEIIRGRIWIVAIKDIRKDEELTYNYGYAYEIHKEHPCACQAHNCVGYILAEEHWPKLMIEKKTLWSSP